LLYHFESDQVYDFWLIQPKIILICSTIMSKNAYLCIILKQIIESDA
jgi:hypothetical protein